MVCHLVCYEKCHCCILARAKMLQWVLHKFCDTEFWNVSGILSSFSVDYRCFLRRLTPVFRASSPVTSTPWKASLFGWVFVYDFFSILSFHNPRRRLFAGDQGHSFWYTIFTFSADTAGFFVSIAGFAFRSGFFGFVSDGFCFACRLDGSRDTFFIWICKKQHV